MLSSGKGVAYFICFFSLLIIAPIMKAQANNLENLMWLPLLSANIKSIQPSSDCPQNKIKDLKVDKIDGQISSEVGLVNWDLNCAQTDHDDNTILSEKQKNEQVKQWLAQLAQLPNFKLRVKNINLLSDLLKDTFSTNLYFKKTESALLASLSGDLLTAQLIVDFTNKNVKLDAVVKLKKLSRYIDLTESYSDYLNNDLAIVYQSDLTRWHKGKFKIDWQGEVAEIAEHLIFSMKGSVDLFKQKISLSAFSINAKKVSMTISETQRWKTTYIKLKLSAPASFHYGRLQLENLPLHLRIGTSVVLTKVPRGKSNRVRIDKQKLPPLFIQLVAKGQGDDFWFSWGVNALNQKLNGTLMVDSKVVQLQLSENSIKLKNLVTSLKRYMDGLDLIEVDTGNITLDFFATYHRKQQAIELKSLLTTDEVEGRYDDILFDGVSFVSKLNYSIDKQNKITIHEDKQQLNIKNLFIGLPIQVLQIDAILNAGEPVVQHFKARLLGGRVDFDDFKLVAPSQTIINIAGLNLAEIINYSAYPEIKSQGIIDAMLPLALTAEGAEIKDGMIFSRAPGGYIKVPKNAVVKAMGQGNPAFSMTMKILSNFQFDSMQGQVGYTSDGNSDLKLEIKGVSPNGSGNQPVHFNYSHNENILKLLKSLRFNEQLLRDMKERY